MSTSSSTFPIDIYTHKNNAHESNTHPSATFNYKVTNCFFQGILSDASNSNNVIGLEFSYYSNSPSIIMKQNSTLKNEDIYYTSRFVIVPIIHDIFSNDDSVFSNDLELIIEHRPDINNTSQVNLYTCFIFTSKKTVKDLSYNAGGFDTLFESINVTNLQAASLNKKNNTNINEANIDNLKQPNIQLSFNSTILNNMSKDIVQTKNTYYYLDKNSNIFIIFNHPIYILNKNYDVLAYSSTTFNSVFIRPVDTGKIFSDTDFKIKSSTAPCDLPFQYQYANTKTQGFTTLKENFSSLREGLIGNYVYCRPSDSSNGSNLVTTTINQYAKNVEKESSILLNDLTMIFVMIIVFIFMCFFAPVWFIFSAEKILGFHTGIYLIFLRVIAFILFFAGGITLIIVSRTDPKSPEWLFLVGLIMIINYILFYAVVFMFQKRNIYEQLKDLIEDKINIEEKKKIKEFAENIFGYME